MKSFFNFKARKKRSKFQALLLSVLIFAGMFYAMADTATDTNPIESDTTAADSGTASSNTDAMQMNAGGSTTGTDESLSNSPISYSLDSSGNIKAIWDKGTKTWEIDLVDTVVPKVKTAIDLEIWKNFKNTYWNEKTQAELGISFDEMNLEFVSNMIQFPSVTDSGSNLLKNCGFFGGFQGEIRGLEKIDTSNVVSMRSMFREAKIGSGFDISMWNMSQVNDVREMFQKAVITGANLDFSGWNTSNIQWISEMHGKKSGLDNLFYEAQISDSDINLSGLKFPSLKYTDLQGIVQTVPQGPLFRKTVITSSSRHKIDMRGMKFPYISHIGNIFSEAKIRNYDIDLKNLDIPMSKGATSLFDSAVLTNSTVDMDHWYLPNVTKMENAFQGSILDKNSAFKMRNWDLPKLEEANSMFAGVKWDNENSDFPTWKNISFVNMQGVFTNAKMPKVDLDLSKWNQRPTLENLSDTFYNANFKALNVANWKFGDEFTLGNAFHELHLEDPAIHGWENQNVSSWEPKKVTGMFATFKNHKQIKKMNLSKWQFSDFHLPFEQSFMGMENLEELIYPQFTVEWTHPFDPSQKKKFLIEDILDSFSQNKYWVVEVDENGEHKGEVSGPYRKKMDAENLHKTEYLYESYSFRNDEGKKFDFKEKTLYKLFHYAPPVTSDSPVTPPSPPTPDPEPAEPPVEPKPEKPEVKPEVKPEPKPEVKPEPAPTPKPVPEPEPFTPPTLSESEPPIESLISSAGASEERETEVLPGMIPAQTSGATASDPSTAVDPGFIPTQTNVAGANLPKTGDGINASSTALLILLLGMSILLYGYVIRKRA